MIKRFKIDGGVKINSVNNDHLKPYEEELVRYHSTNWQWKCYVEAVSNYWIIKTDNKALTFKWLINLDSWLELLFN
jgi:hypothetical protein